MRPATPTSASSRRLPIEVTARSSREGPVSARVSRSAAPALHDAERRYVTASASVRDGVGLVEGAPNSIAITVARLLSDTAAA